jgi:hypothetical protein
VLACLASDGPTEAARTRILENYDWDRNLAAVDRLLEPPGAAAGPVRATPSKLEFRPA